MTTSGGETIRADSHAEIEPLVEWCKAGHLFAVQQWNAEGKPVNPPLPPAKGQRRKTPLEIAIKLGFHSLVGVLLEGGACVEPIGHDSPMSLALSMRRFDMVKLLVAHGFDPQSIDMKCHRAKRTYEMICYYFIGWADEEELLSHIEKLKAHQA